MDSSESPVFGEQEQNTYNRYFESVCHRPLFLFSSQGDELAAKLRPGHVYSAEGWEELSLPEIECQPQDGKEVTFRGDAAFANPEIHKALDERHVMCIIHLPGNDTLERDIEGSLTRPARQPGHRPVVLDKGFLRQAASWKAARRVVPKVEHHLGELFPRVRLIMTNLTLPIGPLCGPTTREGRRSSGSRKASWQ